MGTPFAVRFYSLRVSNPEKMRILAQEQYKACSTMYRINNWTNASWLKALALCLRFYVVFPVLPEVIRLMLAKELHRIIT